MSVSFSFYVLPIFIAIYLWFKLKIPIKKAIGLVLLQPLLFTIPFIISSGFKGFVVFLFGVVLMLPALLYYALIILYIQKRYKLNYIKLFFIGGIVGFIVGFINFAFWHTDRGTIINYANSATLPMITGAVSIVLVEFISRRVKFS